MENDVLIDKDTLWVLYCSSAKEFGFDPYNSELIKILPGLFTTFFASLNTSLNKKSRKKRG